MDKRTFETGFLNRLLSKSQPKNGSHDCDHAHEGVICHPKASIWYILSAYKIWWLLLQQFWRYDW